MGLLSHGINEIIAVTKDNAAPIGIILRDGQCPKMILFKGSKTEENIRKYGWVTANFVSQASLYVYREEYYESRKEPDPETEKHAAWQQKMAKIYNVAEIILAKQRHGPIGTVKVFFDGQLTKFGNLAQEWSETDE